MAFSAGEDYKQVIEALPKEGAFRLYGGFWFLEALLPPLMHFVKNFNPRPTDIYLMTYPKCGTTWIKALAFSVLNRRSFSFENHPLLTTHPQKLVPFLQEVPPPSEREWEDLPSPRLLAGHAHYSLLPDQMKDDSFGCRMIYVARDPKDAFISGYFFVKEIKQGGPSIPFDKTLSDFCDGYAVFGSIWDHQMEYKRESLKRPDKVLFLTYEEMKESPEEHVKRIAEFLGQPFSEEEERGGVVGEIAKLCSFDFLKELEVNKQETTLSRNGDAVFKNSAFFRKGKVGDWKEHLTPEMAKRMDAITQKKKDDYGLI